MNEPTPTQPGAGALTGVPRTNPEYTRAENRKATIALLCEGVTPTVAKVRARSRRGTAGDVSLAIKATLVEAGQALAGEQAAWFGSMPPALVAAFQQIWELGLMEASRSYAERLNQLEAGRTPPSAELLAQIADAATVRLERNAEGLHHAVEKLTAEVVSLRRRPAPKKKGRVTTTKRAKNAGARKRKSSTKRRDTRVRRSAGRKRTRR